MLMSLPTLKSFFKFASVFFLLYQVAIADDPIQFNRDVRPILSDNCFACHGFDAKKREADLRLDVLDGALAKRAEGTAIVPGDLEKSLVWQRIISNDPDEKMPPDHSNKELTESQRDILRRWIEQGAEYERHWSFESPVAVPPRSGNINLVDAYLQDRLLREGLATQPSANRSTLIRRLSFALTGLPPSVEEVDAFLRDTSPNAYETVVDRYLTSPQFGEEMARHWLDVARYADTHGLHLDNERQMWSYRDWVIRAFNENLPFDQFTVWQLAGDLLPEPTLDQLVATGFNRCNVTTSEGGALDDEYRFLYAVDRTSTMMETWLGLTGGCAVCHDHKFDPISNKEYYSLYAFFNNAADPPMDKNIATTNPFVQLPTAKDRIKLESAKAVEANRLKDLRKLASHVEYVDPAEPVADSAKDTVEVVAAKQQVEDVMLDDLFPFGSTEKNTTRNPATWDVRPPKGVRSGMRSLKQASSYFLENEFDVGLSPIVVPEEAILSVWVCPDAIDTPSIIAIEIGKKNEHVVYWGEKDIESYGVPKATQANYRKAMPQPGEWTELNVNLVELGFKPGESIASMTLLQSGGVVWWDRLALRGISQSISDPLSSFRVWWLASKSKQPPEIPKKLHAALKAGPDKCEDPEVRKGLLDFYIAHVARPIDDSIADKREQWQQAIAAREAIEEAIHGSMIFRDEEKVRESFVMERGQYNKPTTQVQPGVLTILPPLKVESDKENATRLELARWLVAPDHPLTARVYGESVLAAVLWNRHCKDEP